MRRKSQMKRDEGMPRVSPVSKLERNFRGRALPKGAVIRERIDTLGLYSKNIIVEDVFVCDPDVSDNNQGASGELADDFETLVPLITIVRSRDPLDGTAQKPKKEDSAAKRRNHERLEHAFLSMIRQAQNRMVGPNGDAQRQLRTERFALGDAVLAAEADRTESTVRKRALGAIRESAKHKGTTILAMQSCRMLAAAFPPGHEARTHPGIPLGLLEAFARMSAEDCEHWYTRVAAGELSFDLLDFIMDAPGQLR